MTLPITNSILNHIFDNLGITSIKKGSIKDSFFMLDLDCVLMDEDAGEHKIASYGGQVFVEGERFRSIYFEISSNEHILIAKLDDCPAYACYLCADERTGEPRDGLIVAYMDSVNRIECDVAMQANFLSGIERLTYILTPWQKLSEHKDLVDIFRSYIEFVDSKYNHTALKNSAA